MKRFLRRFYCYIEEGVFPFSLKKHTSEVPSLFDNFYENWLLQQIEPIINDEKMSDKEKIEKLKDMVENYDPLRY